MESGPGYGGSMRIDLNCDLGETVDGRATADDAAMFPLISSANIACGFHAGDDDAMRTACRLAVQHGVAVGAHVSYRDRENFGRTDMEVTSARLVDDLTEQMSALEEAAREVGTAIRYVKPHGALYNRIAHDRQRADAVAAAIAAFDAQLPLLGLPGSEAERSAADHGLAFVAEAFIDRGYRDDGTLVPRGSPGALLDDEDAAARRAVRIVRDRSVTAVSGQQVALDTASLCVHGDTPGAVGMARAVRAAFAASDIAVEAFF